MDKVEVEITGQPLKKNAVGAVVAVTRSQAKLLIALKRAKLHVPETEKPKRIYRRRDMQAASNE